MKKVLLIAALVFVAAMLWFGLRCGDMLVLNHPEKSDAIVTLAGDANDVRYWRGMQLMREGYARDLLLDASADLKRYGETAAASAQRFVNSSAGELAGRVYVCPVWGDSTAEETKHVNACLQKLHARSVVLVTSDYHTRRAFRMFRRRLPQYRWSVAAAQDPYFFGTHWWQRREWAKTTLMEWQKLIWYKLAER